MAISVGDVLTLRTSKPHTITPRLDIFGLSTIATASINQATLAYPLATLTVDNTVNWSDVKQGQLLRITDGSDTVLWSSVRKDSIANTLYLSGMSLGDSGYSQQIQVALADNQTVTVYSARPLWGFLSRIAGGAFFKTFDVAYSGQGTQPVPVSNSGAWQAGKTTDTFTLPKGGSNTSFAHGAATISSRLWTLPSGVTLAGGYALTDAVIQVTATEGQYLISQTVTDSNSKTHTSYVLLFVGASFGDSYRWTLDKSDSTRQGWNATFTIYGNDLRDVLYPSAAVLFTKPSLFGGESVTAGVINDTFSGYISEIEYSHDGDVPSARVTVLGALPYAKHIPMAKQGVFEKASPSDWTQVTSTLSNPAGFAWYLMQHHCPALLQLQDFDNGSLTTPRKLSASFQQPDLLGQLNGAAELILGNIGSADDGAIVLRKNPLYEGNTYRNALDVRYTWTETDIVPPLSYPYTPHLAYGQTIAYAFAYGGSEPLPLGAIQGKAQAQGVGQGRTPDFIVTTTDGQTRVNEVVGHWHAESNAKTKDITFTVDRNLDIVRPVYMEWQRMTVDDYYDPAGEGWSSDRILPSSVSRSYAVEDNGLVETISVTFQPETFGQPGVFLNVNRGGAANFVDNGLVIGAPVDYSPVEDIGAALLFPLNSAGEAALTFDAILDSPHFANLTDSVDGLWCDHQWDWNCDFFASGLSDGALRLYAVVTEGTSLKIYRFLDIRLSADNELLNTYTMTDSSTTTAARIDVSRTTADFIAVHWRTQSEAWVGRSTDGGDTWGSAVQVGSSYSDTANDNADIGFAIEGDYQLAVGHDGSTYRLYKASTTGGAFSEVASHPASNDDIPLPMIAVDTQGNAYTTLFFPQSALNLLLDASNAETGTGSGYTWETTGTGGGTFSYNVGPVRVLYSRASSGALALSIEYTLTDVGFVDSFASGQVFFQYTTSTPQTSVAHTFNYTFTLEGDDGSEEEISGSVPAPTSAGGSQTSFTWLFNLNTIAIPDGFPLKILTIDLSVTVSGSITDFTNALINLDFPTIQGSTFAGSTLYRIDDYQTAPAWVDVTPATNRAPQAPYGLAVDRADKDRIIVIGSNTHIYDSADNGDDYSDLGASAYSGAKVAGDIGIFFGDNALALSIDSGLTFLDRTGNLAVSFGTLDTIRAVLALL